MTKAMFLLSLLTATTLAAPMAMAKPAVNVGTVQTLRAPKAGVKKHAVRIKKARGHRLSKKGGKKSKAAANGQPLPQRMPNGRFGKKI